MLVLLTLFHVLLAVALILIVLLQSGKGTDLAGAFGGMGSQTAFGPRGTATFLSKATVVLAALFMVTSVGLSIIANRSMAGGESVLSGEQSKPAAPAAGQSSPAPPPSKPGAPIDAVPPTAPNVQVETPGGNPLGVSVTVKQPNEPNKPAAANTGGAQKPAQNAPQGSAAPAPPQSGAQ